MFHGTLMMKPICDIRAVAVVAQHVFGLDTKKTPPQETDYEHRIGGGIALHR
jgi:hypothetical protein